MRNSNQSEEWWSFSTGFSVGLDKYLISNFKFFSKHESLYFLNSLLSIESHLNFILVENLQTSIQTNEEDANIAQGSLLTSRLLATLSMTV
jgi:hypothetical protein